WLAQFHGDRYSLPCPSTEPCLVARSTYARPLPSRLRTCATQDRLALCPPFSFVLQRAQPSLPLRDHVLEQAGRHQQRIAFVRRLIDDCILVSRALPHLPFSHDQAGEFVAYRLDRIEVGHAPLLLCGPSSLRRRATTLSCLRSTVARSEEHTS